MARFGNGWVRLHRSIFGSWIFKDAEAYRVFTLLIGWGNNRPTSTIFEGKNIAVGIGQIVTSAQEIAGQLGIDKRTVMRKLDLLELNGVLSQRMSHRGRIITINNYSVYQSTNDDDCHTDSTAACTATGTAVGTLIEEKRKKKKQNTINSVLSCDSSGNSLGPAKAKQTQRKKSWDIPKDAWGIIREFQCVFFDKKRSFTDYNGINDNVEIFLKTMSLADLRRFGAFLLRAWDQYGRRKFTVLLWDEYLALWKASEDNGNASRIDESSEGVSMEGVEKQNAPEQGKLHSEASRQDNFGIEELPF